ncbi:response regulator transcription factor [Winogradskya consettensis]|uniref:DNA-binding response regulator n=1 Tax=Winogradskya consettensis TaxID=113560 RepID=A0A919VY63_9ACTN|nr:response regulator transcription factor [Actinoplanes consettensis]GIM82067.1 DNA-binding response regulator [Actinoplanes consettensis]
MTQVMIVDDQEIIRAGLRTIIDAHPGLSVIAEAADGFEALRLLASAVPDVVLMDIRMPGIDGVETTRRIRAAYPAEQVRILVLTTFDQDQNVVAALRAGADGFFNKGTGPVELTAGILRVASGRNALSPAAVDALVGHVAEDRGVPVDAGAAERFAGLTAREAEVVTMIVQGLDNAAIAGRLHVSPFTVKTHANRAMAKVGARDRAQLVTRAFQAGIRPGP